jgi:integrase
MGRRRKRDKHLPQRVYLSHGAYFFRPKDGKPVNLGRDLADALTRYASIIGRQWTGRTLGDVIDPYRLEVLPLKRSDRTREDEGKALDRLKAVFGHMLPDDLTAQALYKYQDTRRSKEAKPVPVAARHEVALLGHVFTKAIRWGVARSNPVRGMDFGERSAKRAQVPIEQVEALKAVAGERLSVAIDLAVSTGQRRGDLLKLRRDQLTNDGIVFKQSKTGAGVLIEWSEDLRAIVDRAKRLAPQIPCEYLIRTRKGKQYSAEGFSAIWQRAMAKHVRAGGQRFSFHDLRSVSADGAATAEEAQARLGHASVQTTKRHYFGRSHESQAPQVTRECRTGKNIQQLAEYSAVGAK